MDPMAEEQLDYGDDDFGAGNSKFNHQGGGGAIPAIADEEIDDEFDDLYNDVNVGENFTNAVQQQKADPIPNLAQNPGFGNGAGRKNPMVEPPPPLPPNVSIRGVATDQNPNPNGGNMNNSRVPEELAFRGGPGPSPGQVMMKIAPPQMPPTSRLGPPVGNPAPTAGGPVGASGPTMLFVGELHWWTTDDELESALSQYGRVKEIKFYDERASGKSKGYCQVEFYDAMAASACKEGMDGYHFNGRACVVAFASPQTLRQMGASYVNRNQQQGGQPQQGRRQMNDGMGRGNGGANDGGGRNNFGRGGWGGRGGGQVMMNRGQGSGMMRGRGFNNGGKGMMGPGGGGVGVGAGGPFGQGFGQGFAGPAGGLMHPQGMMGGGFDPTYMGRGGPYGGFANPAFTGLMPSFQAVNAVGLPGVAPHVNPAFFGRGMSANGMGGMGMMGGSGMEGQMWGDVSMGAGWTGEEHGRRTRESSYGGDDGASEYGFGDERGGRSNASREKERGSERDWSGNSERRHRDEKEQDWERSDRERHREEKDGYKDYRSRDHDYDNEDDWDRGQSSSRSRRPMQEDDHRSRSRDADYGKRRRLPSE